ncbi:MAG: metal-sensitive transcriptional regulator [Mahellales bacterium]|jgi:DNA-binding FrmR family transcriptional regulator
MDNENRTKEDIINRLKKIEGQVKGIQRMVNDEKYCVDILVQIAAVRAAINKVGGIILKQHTLGCIKKGLDCEDREDKIEELIGVFMKFMN